MDIAFLLKHGVRRADSEDDGEDSGKRQVPCVQSCRHSKQQAMLYLLQRIG